MPAAEILEEVKRGEVAVTYPPATVSYSEKGNVRTYHYVLDDAVKSFSILEGHQNVEGTVDLLHETLVNVADVAISIPWWFKRPDADGLFIVSKRANSLFGLGASGDSFKKEFGIPAEDTVTPVEVTVKMVSGEGDSMSERYFGSFTAVTIEYLHKEELKTAEILLRPHFATKIEELPSIAHHSWNSSELATIKLGLAGNGVTYWDIETNRPEQKAAPEAKEYFLEGLARILLTISDSEKVRALADSLRNLGKDAKEDKKRRVRELLTEINIFMLENNL